MIGTAAQDLPFVAQDRFSVGKAAEDTVTAVAALTLRLDSRWSLGFGFQWRWKDDRWISATLN